MTAPTVSCARCGVTLSGGGWGERPSVIDDRGGRVCANGDACRERVARANPTFSVTGKPRGYRRQVKEAS